MSAAREKTRLIKLVDKRSVSWEQALQEYLLWKKAKGRSERTIKDYSYHIKLIFKRFPEASLSDQAAMKRVSLSTWLRTLNRPTTTTN